MSIFSTLPQNPLNGLAVWVSRKGGTGGWAAIRDVSTNSKTGWSTSATGTSNLGQVEAAVVFATTPSHTIDKMLVLFKTDTILDPPESAQVTFDFTNITNTNPGTGDNVTRWVFAKPSKDFIVANLENSVALFDNGAANPGGDTHNDIDDWSAGAVWNSTLYSDIILHTDLTIGLYTINLNKQARIDMARFDSFGFWVQNYTHDQLNQDPGSVSASPGSATEARWRIDAPNTLLTYMPGKTRESVPDKDRIEKNFTINSFADITDQRNRFTKNGIVTDQVPFLLGAKGPLSLRGRQLDNTGIPISTTVDPPNTSKS